MNWVSGYNGSPGTPISIANFWIYKFQNINNAYANWSQVLQTGALAPSQGFTMKGSGAAGLTQNYVFNGKPYNGDINNPISANNLNLSGNPYASAIDANKFIDDNVSSLAGQATTTGTLYYWEHSAANNTHNLQDYQGGYAAYTKVGGTPPIAPAGINGLGGNTKVAGRFIPVGQAFFVIGSTTGGNINFNNSQRIFVKEDDPNSFTMFRNGNNPHTTANANDDYDMPNFAKIRLGFNSSNNYHRQILLGFMNENATSGIDPGYDGIHIDNQPNDMYFLNQGTKLTIQGDGAFSDAKIFPLSVKVDAAGTVQFVLDGVENFGSNQKIYIHDNVTNTYFNIKTQPYQVTLAAGNYDNRFYLTFRDKKRSIVLNKNEETPLTDDQVKVVYAHTNQMLNITNNTQDNTVKNVFLYNILGQFISKWEVSGNDQSNIQIPIKNVKTGVYIVKIETANGSISKKISIK